MNTRRVGPVSGFACIHTLWRVFNPRRDGSSTGPLSAHLPQGAEQLSVRSTADHVRLAGWFLPSGGPHAVIICHGLGQTHADVLPQAARLVERGFHVVVYDLRSHGASDARPRFTKMASRYVADLSSVVRHVRNDPRVVGRIGVLALSFSTWPAVIVATRAGAISGLVCDSGPEASTGGRALGNIAALRATLKLRKKPPRRALETLASRVAAFVLAEPTWPPKSLPTPTLLVAGGRDRVIDSAEVTAFARGYARASVHLNPRAAHVSSFKSDPNAYIELVSRHFADAMSGAFDDLGGEEG